MKKYLFGALALPLLFACSSDDLLEEKVVGNDQFAGIEKVDATFSMDEGPATRMDNGSWNPQEGDKWGFAWMTDAHTATPSYTPVITIDGKAYQNHNLIQTNSIFTPQTSIYVGKYYLYRPYDSLTVSPKAIDFKSLEEQPLADGYAPTTQAWKDLAKTAINIGDKFTEVTPTGRTIAGKTGTWDKAGTKQHYEINGAFFSNQTGLDLTYTKNKVSAPAGGMHIAGATDIDYTIAAGTELDAADIYEAKVQLTGAPKSFSYAPKREPVNGGAHSGDFWATQSNLNANNIASALGDAFNWASGTGFDEITLKAADENGVSTDKADNKGWFWFNSLPVTDASGATSTAVKATLTTSYGVVTISSNVGACAYELENYTNTTGIYDNKASHEWIKLDAADDATTSPKKWNVAAANHKTFINHYGNHKGKYALTADFSTGVMDGMHIKNDAQLQKLLKYYIAAGKTESGVVLNLDGDNATDKTFKLSKISIALLQKINATTPNTVLVTPCITHNNPVKIVITQEGQDKIGLADKKEVPALDRVFAVSTDVYLTGENNTEWTWAGGDGDDALTIDANVKSITNEGTLTVTATNVELTTVTPAATLANAAGATMNITKVTTVKNALTNLGTINVGSDSEEGKKAELRAYGIEIKNDATSLTASGTINNYGVVGVSAGTGTSAKFNNYGTIDMKNDGAITLLTSNEKSAATLPFGPFSKAFVAASNKMGTVVLPNGNPLAIVSVSNKTDAGFIKYNWTDAAYTHDTRNVKYNTLVVSNDIEFKGAAATEITFIEFNGTRTQVVNPATSNNLPNLKGIIVNAGKSIILEKDNRINCLDGISLRDAAATIYRGGELWINGSAPLTTTNYFTPAYNWSLNQIVEY